MLGVWKPCCAGGQHLAWLGGSRAVLGAIWCGMHQLLQRCCGPRECKGTAGREGSTAADLWFLLCASLHTKGGATELWSLLYCAHRCAPQVATFTRDTERLQANLEKIRSEIR